LFLFLVLVLAVHIYWVTRPKAPDANTKIMARIDIKQPITQADADKITTWLYQQKGIDHVLVNDSREEKKQADRRPRCSPARTHPSKSPAPLT